MVQLRVFAEAELEYFSALPGAAEDPYSWFGFRGVGAATMRGRWLADRLVTQASGILAIDLDGEVIGDVSWHTMGYGPPPMSDAVNIGIRVRPAHQGHGHGSAAQAALATYLFATYPLNRVEADTDVTNLAEQRALEKAGFTREGVLRGAQWRSGAWHDLVRFARLRDDARPA